MSTGKRLVTSEVRTCMPLDDGGGAYQHRSNIDGIPHCPHCGGMLWPPDFTGPVVDADGNKLNSILDGDATETYYHVECWGQMEGEDVDAHEPEVPSENERQPQSVL